MEKTKKFKQSFLYFPASLNDEEKKKNNIFGHLVLLGEVTKAKNIKADLQRRIKPTAGGAEKKIEKD